VLNAPVSEIILNESRIRVLVSQGEAASVPEHVRMGKQGQGSGGAVFMQGQVHGRSVQQLPLFANKECPTGRFHPCAFFEPSSDCPQLVAA
jgi:hypothetical protein